MCTEYVCVHVRMRVHIHPYSCPQAAPDVYESMSIKSVNVSFYRVEHILSVEYHFTCKVGM
jgi:hypothetical protein